MKSVTIELIHDPDCETVQQHEFEVMATTNGVYYYQCLESVFGILSGYEKIRKKEFTKEEKDLLEDIRKRCANNFRGIQYHGKK